jgi:hypothetical protein
MRYLLIAHVTCVIAGTSAAAQGESALREWLICGAFPGLAGVSVLGVDAEAHLRPAEGDVVALTILDKRIKTEWRRFESSQDRVDLESDRAFREHPDFAYPRGCAYACVYLSTPQETSARLSLRTLYRLRAWLDRETVADGEPIELGPTPRRLLLKVCAPRVNEPQFGKGWWFEAGLTDPAGQPVRGLQVRLSDPDRTAEEIAPEPGATLGQLTELHIVPTRPRCTFLPTEEAGAGLQVGLMPPEQRTERFGSSSTQFDGREIGAILDWQAFDYDGREIADGGAPVTYSLGSPSLVYVTLGRLPVGFYTVFPTLKTREGRVLRRCDPVGIAVVRGRTPEADSPRKLASAFYWMSSSDWKSYIPWLARIGLNLNLGVCASWWTEGYRPDTDAYRPEFDELLALGEAEGVEFVGYLDGGWPAEMNPKLNLQPDQLFIWFWQPLPAWDSDQYEQLLRDYTFKTVSRFRDRVHVWKSYNELDGTPMRPEVYVHAAKLMREEIARADPAARFIGASFYKAPEALFERIVEFGGMAYHDAVDVHCYPLHGAQFGQDIDLWPTGGVDGYSAVLAKHGIEKPFWWGEIGARRAYAMDGAREQCDLLLQMAAVGLATPNVEILAWCDPYAAHADDFSLARPTGSAMPVICSLNAAAHSIDGRRFVGAQTIGGVQVGEFVGRESEVLVLWGRGSVSLEANGPVELTDALGRSRPLEPTAGRVTVDPEGHVVFVRGAGLQGANE